MLIVCVLMITIVGMMMAVLAVADERTVDYCGTCEAWCERSEYLVFHESLSHITHK